MLLSYQKYPIFGRLNPTYPTGTNLITFPIFYFVLNSLKDVEFLYSDGKLTQRNSAL